MTDPNGKLFCVALGVFSLLMTSGTAMAVSHATKFSMPLRAPYTHCNEETSTTDCNGTYTPLSPWDFVQGTVEITSSSVGLRLDDIYLRTSFDCSDVGGGTSACRCWDSNDSTYCSVNSECAGACGPSSQAGTDNNYFKVEIWAENYHPGGALCGNGGICPHIERDACHKVVEFDVKNVSGNRNEDVDQSESLSWADCQTGLPEYPEIRHVEVYDKWDNLVAVGANN